MVQAGWGELFERGLSLFAAEPIELRLAVGLGLLLGLLTLIAGLRAAILPLVQRRPAPVAMIAQPEPIRPIQPMPSAAPQRRIVAIAPAAMKLRARIATPAKTVTVRAKPFRSYRPRIRTAIASDPKIMVTDEGAPFSSLSPNGDQSAL